jgi:hypothetical protein
VDNLGNSKSELKLTVNNNDLAKQTKTEGKVTCLTKNSYIKESGGLGARH